MTATEQLRIVTVTPAGESMAQHASLTLHFDGAAEPTNPGVATYGWALTADGGEEVVAGYGLAAWKETNNTAEYTALGMALRWLADQGWRGRLTIHGDSMLVVKQVKGEWQCNRDHLRALRDRVRELLGQVATEYVLEWIPREKNERADALSRRAYEEATGKPFPERRRK